MVEGLKVESVEALQLLGCACQGILDLQPLLCPLCPSHFACLSPELRVSLHCVLLHEVLPPGPNQGGQAGMDWNPRI